MDNPQVLKHAELDHVLQRRGADPAGYDSLPGGDTVAPLAIAGHDAARTAGHADKLQPFNHPDWQTV